MRRSLYETQSLSILCRLYQFRIRKLRRINQFCESIPENMFVFPVIKTMLQFIQIGVQMLNAHFMVRTNDRTLQEAPNALDAVGVNIADNPFLGEVINPSVLRVGIFDSPISRHFVRVDRFRVRRGIIVNELVKHGLSSVRDNLQTNLSLALDGSDCDGLIAFVTSPHAASLSPHVSLVHFNNSAQKLSVNVSHGSPDSMAEIPSRLVGDVYRPLDLKTRHSFLPFRHKVNGEEPLRQRKVRVMKDRATRYRELITASVAVVLIALDYIGHAF